MVRWSTTNCKRFEYAWNRVLDPATASPYAWIYDEANVESVEAPDESTFIVHLKAPAEYFLRSYRFRYITSQYAKMHVEARS